MLQEWLVVGVLFAVIAVITCPYDRDDFRNAFDWITHRDR
jgi:hypothetical protein